MHITLLFLWVYNLIDTGLTQGRSQKPGLQRSVGAQVFKKRVSALAETAQSLDAFLLRIYCW